MDIDEHFLMTSKPCPDCGADMSKFTYMDPDSIEHTSCSKRCGYVRKIDLKNINKEKK